MTRLGRLINLPKEEKYLLAQAMVLLPFNAVMLRLLSLKRWQGMLAAFLPRLQGGQDVRAPVCASVAAVNRAARYGLINANCLQRSLALWWMLRSQGIVSDLKIGARINGQQCEAHAWIEYAGEVLNDEEDVAERFPPFNGVIFPAEAKIQ
ncbi:MAG: lasso peptide biosynthesis B2 protein [Blastocatellales bacterium]